MKFLLLLVLSLNCNLAFSDPRSEFCSGFELGYKTVKGNNVYVPYCPYMPMTPYGSTPYQEGIKAGQHAAKTGK